TPAAFSYRGISRRQYENGPIVEPVRADRPGNPGRIGVAGGTGRTGASCAPIRYDGTAAAGRRSRFFRTCLRGLRRGGTRRHREAAISPERRQRGRGRGGEGQGDGPTEGDHPG